MARLNSPRSHQDRTGRVSLRSRPCPYPSSSSDGKTPTSSSERGDLFRSRLFQDAWVEKRSKGLARARRAFLFRCDPLLFFHHHVEHVGWHDHRKRVMLPACRNLRDGMPCNLRHQREVRRRLRLHLIDGREQRSHETHELTSSLRVTKHLRRRVK